MSSAVWKDTVVDVFCDLCVKEVEKHNRPNTHFNKEGWENVVNDFFKETGLNFTRKQLKNKWDSLKELWKLWKDLKGKETRLGWDHTLQTIDASEEWWGEKIKENKEYAMLRKKGISPAFEEKLDRMFKGTSATGLNAYIPGASVSLPESPIQVDNEDDAGERYSSDDTVQSSKRRKKNGKDKEASSKHGKVGGVALLAHKIDRMCEALASRRKSVGTSDDTSIAAVMKVVRSLPGCEQGTGLFFFATRLFLQKEKREMFCSMQGDEMKLQYLKYEAEN